MSKTPPSPPQGAPLLFLLCGLQAMLGGIILCLALSKVGEGWPAVFTWTVSITAGLILPAWLAGGVAEMAAQRRASRRSSRSLALIVMVALHGAGLVYAVDKGVGPPAVARQALLVLRVLGVFPDDATARRNVAGSVLVDLAGPGPEAAQPQLPTDPTRPRPALRPPAPEKMDLRCPRNTQEMQGPYPGQYTNQFAKWRYCILPNGFMHGPSVQWHSTMQPRERGSFKDGLKSGYFERWDERGRLVARGPFTDDLPSGAWEEWADSQAGDTGEPLQRQETGSYRDGLRQGEWTTLVFRCNAAADLDSCPRTKSTRTYASGQIRGLAIQWRPDGRKASEGLMVNGQKDGEWKRWAEDGSLAEQRSWAMGTPSGLWRRLCPDGSVLDATQYNGGKKHGAYTAYHRSGKKLVVGRYSHGKPDGTWSTWPDEGGQEVTTLFQHGDIVEGEDIEPPLDCTRTVAAAETPTLTAPREGGPAGRDDPWDFIGELQTGLARKRDGGH